MSKRFEISLQMLVYFVAVATLLTTLFISTGCHYRVQTPLIPASSQSPFSASDISGGRVTTFFPRPGSLSDPADKVMLAATRYIGLLSQAAKSEIIEFRAGGHGLAQAHALVVGNETLVIVADIMRQGFGVLIAPMPNEYYALHNGVWVKTKSNRRLCLFNNDGLKSTIILCPNSRQAFIGRTMVTLKHRVVWLHGNTKYLQNLGTDGQYVMTLSDLLNLFRLHDAQLNFGRATTITQVRIIQ